MATIGTVTYPTDTTWESTVTGLVPGTYVFRVTDGVATQDVTVTVLAAVAAGSGGAQATVRIAQPISGTAAGSAQVSGTEQPTYRVPGVAAGDADATATLTVQPPLAGPAAGHAQAAGTLSFPQPGVAQAFDLRALDGASISFAATLFSLRALDGTSVGVGIAPSGYFGPAVDLAGTAAGYAGATATPGVVQQLSGTAAGHGDTGGSSDVAGFEGEAGGHGDASGTLGQRQALGGEAGGHAGAVATGPQVPVGLGGTAGGHADASGEIGRVAAAGSTGGHADAIGALSRDQAISGTAAGQAQARAGVSLDHGPEIAHARGTFFDLSADAELFDVTCGRMLYDASPLAEVYASP